MEGDSLAAVETRRARDLLQTAVVQQQAYSYNRHIIHSTPHPSKSYSRHMDEPVVSSSAQCRDAPRGANPANGGQNAQDVVDNGRARREAALAAQYAGHHQPAPVQPAASIERGTELAFSSRGVPCLIPALRNVRLPKDFKGSRKVPNYTAD